MEPVLKEDGHEDFIDCFLHLPAGGSVSRPAGGPRGIALAGDVRDESKGSSTMNLGHLLDCPVISASTGGRLGRVAEIVLDVRHRRVIGFRLRHGGLFDRRWRVAAIEDILRLDGTGIFVAQAIALREDVGIGVKEEGRVRLCRRGIPVFDESGSKLGRAQDALAPGATEPVGELLIVPTSGWTGYDRPPVAVSLTDLYPRRGNSLVLERGATGWLALTRGRA